MADIYLDGCVGWEITAKKLRDELKECTDNDVTLHINSGGGDVFEGVAIASVIRSERDRGRYITAMVDGYAASAASYMGLSANRVVMSPGAMMMIHNPSSGCWGDAEDMRRTARALDACRDSIVNLYYAKTGLDRDGIRMSMDETTWFTAEGCVNLGLADEVLEGTSTRDFAVQNPSYQNYYTPPKTENEPTVTRSVDQKPQGSDAPAKVDEGEAKEAKAWFTCNGQVFPMTGGNHASGTGCIGAAAREAAANR